jgi:hypothetical protein
MHGFEVFPAAVDVRNPFALLAAVVAVEHRGHRIDTQSIDAVLLDPEQGVANEIVENLASAKVVDQRSPVLVHAFAWIGMLVERLAIEAGEAVCIGREVRWNPVDNHFEAGVVARGHEVPEALR